MVVPLYTASPFAKPETVSNLPFVSVAITPSALLAVVVSIFAFAVPAVVNALSSVTVVPTISNSNEESADELKEEIFAALLTSVEVTAVMVRSVEILK